MTSRVQEFQSSLNALPFMLGTKPPAPPRVTDGAPGKCVYFFLPLASWRGRGVLGPPLTFAQAVFQTHQGGMGVSSRLWKLILTLYPEATLRFRQPSLRGEFPVQGALRGRCWHLPSPKGRGSSTLPPRICSGGPEPPPPHCTFLCEPRAGRGHRPHGASHRAGGASPRLGRQSAQSRGILTRARRAAPGTAGGTAPSLTPWSGQGGPNRVRAAPDPRHLPPVSAGCGLRRPDAAGPAGEAAAGWQGAAANPGKLLRSSLLGLGG